MAIRLSEEYPGQVDTTTDPTGYPHGQPKNRSGVDTNDGTPFEAQWMSDVHGFLQAMLAEAGVTPSDSPDKVGASQYLDSVKHAASLPGVADTYPEAVERRVFLPLMPFMGQSGSQDYSFDSDGEGYLHLSPGTVSERFYLMPLRLPHGASLKSVRALFHIDGQSGGLQMKLGYWEPAWETDEAGSWTLIDSDFDGSGGTFNMLSIDLSATPHAVHSEREYRLIFRTTANSRRLYWVEVVFDDPGPRNF
jgi:hypothetical protein